MGLFDFLRAKPKHTASIAKERLRIIVAQERTARGTPDYLPMLRRELLEVIRKYVNVDVDAVKVDNDEGARKAIGAANKVCTECHEAYRS